VPIKGLLASGWKRCSIAKEIYLGDCLLDTCSLKAKQRICFCSSKVEQQDQTRVVYKADKPINMWTLNMTSVNFEWHAMAKYPPKISRRNLTCPRKQPRIATYRIVSYWRETKSYKIRTHKLGSLTIFCAFLDKIWLLHCNYHASRWMSRSSSLVFLQLHVEKSKPKQFHSRYQSI